MADTAAPAGLLGNVPLFAVVLMAGHVVALVYLMYKLASQKQSPRSKTH